MTYFYLNLGRKVIRALLSKLITLYTINIVFKQMSSTCITSRETECGLLM